MATRYGSESMEKVYGSSLLPVVGKNNSLNFRLFSFAHMSSNPLHNFSATSKLGDCHLPLDLTLIQANSGVFSCHTMLTCRKYSYFLKLCSHCILKAGGPGRLYSCQPGDSRLISFLGGSEVIFHSVSLDLFADISVLAHAGHQHHLWGHASTLLTTAKLCL